MVVNRISLDFGELVVQNKTFENATLGSEETFFHYFLTLKKPKKESNLKNTSRSTDNENDWLPMGF